MKIRKPLLVLALAALLALPAAAASKPDAARSPTFRQLAHWMAGLIQPAPATASACGGAGADSHGRCRPPAPAVLPQDGSCIDPHGVSLCINPVLGW
ncbi:MAG: hypothetical protein M3O15_06000 [Acidobacteriota bacterium]|nr:hypothetical protein [Acidobacteriota bacterium]